MGISTYQSYCGAQIFEAIGLKSDFVDKYFTGTATPDRRHRLAEVAEEAMRSHRQAYSDDPVLSRTRWKPGANMPIRVRGEEHMWTPESSRKLQHATRSNNGQTYKEYRAS